VSVDWRQTSERLVRFARRRLQRRGVFDEELAQDIAGEALVRYFDPAYASFDSERHESVAYFLGSTVNGLLRNYFMKLNRRGERFIEDLPIDIQERSIPAHQLGRVEGEETLVRLRSMLEGDDELLAIFDLKLQGFSTPREQSAVSDLTRKQIYSATRRAARRFRNGGVLPTKNTSHAKDNAMTTAPPVTELLDACSRWGIDGAAEEYGVTTAQVCAWMREHPEEVPEQVDLDAPVVWAGRNIRKDAPSMRRVWAWKNQLDSGVPVDELATKEKTNTRFISTHVKMLEEHLSANNAPRSEGAEMEEKKEEAAASNKPAPRTMNDWQPLASLSRQPKAPSLNSLHRRAQSTHPQWAHYESEDVDKVEEDFDLRTKTVYRITPGYTFKKLTHKEQLGWGASATEEPTEMLHIPPNAPLPKKVSEVVSLEVSLADKEARIDELQRALKKQRQEITQAEEALEEISKVLESHTALTSEELGTDDMCKLIEAAFADASKASKIETLEETIEVLRINEGALKDQLHDRSARLDFLEKDERKAHLYLEYFGFDRDGTSVSDKLEQLVARQDVRHIGEQGARADVLEWIEAADAWVKHGDEAPLLRMLYIASRQTAVAG